jgi:predicted ATPase
MKSGEVPVQGGPRHDPVNLRLGFCDEAVGYSIDIGLPIPSSSLFSRDPEIKRECIFAAPAYRPSGLLAERRNAMSRVRDDAHEWMTLSTSLSSFDSMLFTIADARARARWT